MALLFAASVVFALSALRDGLDYRYNGVLAYYFDLSGSSTSVSSWFRYFIPLLCVVPIALSGCVVDKKISLFVAVYSAVVLAGTAVPLALFASSVNLYAGAYVFIVDFLVPVLTPFVVLFVTRSTARPVSVTCILAFCDVLGKIVFALAYRIDNWTNTATIIAVCAVPLVVPVMVGIFIFWRPQDEDPKIVHTSTKWTAQAVLAGFGIVSELFLAVVYPTYGHLAVPGLGRDPLLGLTIQVGAAAVGIAFAYLVSRSKGTVLVLIVGYVMLSIGTTVCACIPIVASSEVQMYGISAGVAIAVPGYFLVKYILFSLVIAHAQPEHVKVILSLQAGLLQLSAIVTKALYCQLAGFHGIHVGAAFLMGLSTIALMCRLHHIIAAPAGKPNVYPHIDPCL